jgi:DNA replication protein DnaC
MNDDKIAKLCEKIKNQQIKNGEKYTMKEMVGKFVFNQSFFQQVLENTIKNTPCGSPEHIKAKLSKEGGFCPECNTMWTIKQFKGILYDYSHYVGCECWDYKINQKFQYDELRQIYLLMGIPKRFMNSSFYNLSYSLVAPDTAEALRHTERYIDEKKYQHKGIIISGQVGVGKTHSGIAIIKKLYEHGKQGLCLSSQEFKNAICDHEEKTIPYLYSRYDFIMIDDLDKMQTNSYVNERLFDFINSYYNAKKILVITCNLTSKELVTKFNAAIASRLLSMCFYINIPGSDYRNVKGPVQNGL